MHENMLSNAKLNLHLGFFNVNETYRGNSLENVNIVMGNNDIH